MPDVASTAAPESPSSATLSRTAPTRDQVASPTALRDPNVQLMLQVRDGDEAAFGELVEKFQARLVTVFTHLVGDRSLAEDLSQEAFLRVYRARAGYVPTAKFSTWLYRIAHNLASNARRGLGRKKEVRVDPKEGSATGTHEQMAVEKSGLMPSRMFAKDELREKVRDALDTLSDRQRLAVLLHRFEGMPYADIAETMELTPAAVKSLLARARENLRSKLEPYVK
ncbi:MAG: sigma-70 family RNA polymerase sigma factor [Planctomycetota bacterium]